MEVEINIFRHEKHLTERFNNTQFKTYNISIDRCLYIVEILSNTCMFPKHFRNIDQ